MKVNNLPRRTLNTQFSGESPTRVVPKDNRRLDISPPQNNVNSRRVTPSPLSQDFYYPENFMRSNSNDGLDLYSLEGSQERVNTKNYFNDQTTSRYQLQQISQNNIRANTSIIEEMPTHLTQPALVNTALKMPLRYAGEVGELLRVFQGYEYAYNGLVQQLANKLEYTGKNITSGECLQRHQTISNYYFKGQDDLGKTYSKKETYKGYIELLGTMMKSIAIKGLSSAATNPKKFAREYNLSNDEAEKLCKFVKELKASAKKLIQDIAESEPSLRKMALDTIKDQVLGTFTDQLKSSLGLNCVQNAMSSTVGKVAVLAVTAVGAAAIGGIIGKIIGENSGSTASNGNGTSASTGNNGTSTSDSAYAALLAENTALQAGEVQSKADSLDMMQYLSTLTAAFASAMRDAIAVPPACAEDSKRKPGYLDDFNLAYNSTFSSIPSTSNSTQLLEKVLTQTQQIITTVNVCSG